MGLAVGDALGTTLEFRTDLHPPPFPKLATGPHKEITGGGPFRLKPGQVTDDTAMACLLTEGMRPDVGPYGEVANAVPLYLKWLRAGPPDVGNQTRRALDLVRSGVEPTEAGRRVWEQSGRRAAGNGSLMRTAPIGVFFAGQFPALWDASFQDSAVTHFDPRCQLACAALNSSISEAVERDEIVDLAYLNEAPLKALFHAGERLLDQNPGEASVIRSAIEDLREDMSFAEGDDPRLDGPVLRLTGMEAGFVRVAFRLAFWELFHARSFEAGLIDVVNRGGDADTNGAIAGALLGARFGVMEIPSRWRHAVLDAPPEERLGEMAEMCHPSRMFGPKWNLKDPIDDGPGSLPAIFSHWFTQPLPQMRARLSFQASFTKEEYAQILLGVRPQEMEDKWFIYTEDGVTHFHRSWTGFEVFRMSLAGTGDGVAVSEAWVNRDPRQYTWVADEKDAATLRHLIDALILKRDSEWPGVGTQANPLAEWSVMGRAMLAQDATGEKAAKLDTAIRAGAKAKRKRKATERSRPQRPRNS